MSFNKWFPDRPPEPRRMTPNERRAFFLRSAWWISTLMLVTGYLLMFAFWKR